MADSPPYYILFSHNSFSGAANTTAVPQSATLGHPTVQYHHTDDSPHALLPKSSDEHVLILEHDPSSPSTPSVKSISQDMIVTGLKVTDAPGAAADEGGPPKNDRMYIIETIMTDDRPMDASSTERRSPQAILSQFKQRNVALRRAFQYPEPDIEHQP
ncbi:hypothetical protein HGRIS_007705 [Hohenbuehelia grisea]|uniref:Uncharacterized protein n=1 Tax=Hohenbuehelia grisea TaxID=104357 RepID=A0ABR3J630_9AGAR